MSRPCELTDVRATPLEEDGQLGTVDDVSHAQYGRGREPGVSDPRGQGLEPAAAIGEHAGDHERYVLSEIGAQGLDDLEHAHPLVDREPDPEYRGADRDDDGEGEDRDAADPFGDGVRSGVAGRPRRTRIRSATARPLQFAGSGPWPRQTCQE